MQKPKNCIQDIVVETYMVTDKGDRIIKLGSM